MKEKRIVMDPSADVSFHNQVDFCVGTGRMGLALTKEYMDQLKLVPGAYRFQAYQRTRSVYR